jgi:hypothetical protein
LCLIWGVLDFLWGSSTTTSWSLMRAFTFLEKELEAEEAATEVQRVAEPSPPAYLEYATLVTLLLPPYETL